MTVATLAAWAVLVTWALAFAGWCGYQLGYTRGLRRARAIWEPALDQLTRQAGTTVKTPTNGPRLV